MKLLNFRSLSGVAGGADTSRTVLAYGVESTYGTAPTDFTKLRFNRSSINHRNRTAVSAEIRSDRNRSDVMPIAYGVDGGFESEFHSALFTGPPTNSGGFDDLIEAALCGTWTTNVLKNGIVNRSFHFEQGYTDIDKYISYQGCVINGMTLNMAAGAFITVGFDIIGRQGLVGTDPLDATPTEPNTLPPLTSGPFIDLSGNADLAVAKCRSLRLAITNNVRERMAVDSYYTANPGRGSCDVTGSMELYFEDTLLYAKFMANTAIDFHFHLNDTATGGTKYEFRMPKMKLSSGSADISGIDADVVLAVDFRALFDTTEACELMITRSAV